MSTNPETMGGKLAHKLLVSFRDASDDERWDILRSALAQLTLELVVQKPKMKPESIIGLMMLTSFFKASGNLDQMVAHAIEIDACCAKVEKS